MMEFEKLDLHGYVAMVWQNTWLTGDYGSTITNLGKILGVNDTSTWSVFGEYKDTGNKSKNVVLLIPVDDAKKIGATYLTWKLSSFHSDEVPVWYCDLLKTRGDWIPERVKSKLEGCHFYGTI